MSSISNINIRSYAYIYPERCEHLERGRPP
jgi:hypothetical protein